MQARRCPRTGGFNVVWVLWWGTPIQIWWTSGRGVPLQGAHASMQNQSLFAVCTNKLGTQPPGRTTVKHSGIPINGFESIYSVLCM
jgi:hypothetical protein